MASAKTLRLVHPLDFLVLEHADFSVLPLKGVLDGAVIHLGVACGVQVSYRVKVLAFPLSAGPALSELLRSVLLLLWRHTQ